MSSRTWKVTAPADVELVIHGSRPKHRDALEQPTKSSAYDRYLCLPTPSPKVLSPTSTAIKLVYYDDMKESSRTIGQIHTSSSCKVIGRVRAAVSVLDQDPLEMRKAV